MTTPTTTSREEGTFRWTIRVMLVQQCQHHLRNQVRVVQLLTKNDHTGQWMERDLRVEMTFVYLGVSLYPIGFFEEGVNVLIILSCNVVSQKKSY